MRTFQQQYQQRQTTFNPPYATKKAPYPNKTINDIAKKEFLGTIITANLGEIKKFLDFNTLQINSIKDESGKSILHLILEVDDNKLSENEKLEILNFILLISARDLSRLARFPLGPLLIRRFFRVSPSTYCCFLLCHKQEPL